ncbi:MAG TPA: 2-C-methyl-D-erythritol 2,4-cyclodiphosphate synthase [Planctomycetota bacterium]|nr:2-C-methyl-D-erythritol 2,4-cyclodiphosphate synthase [Planctomycetota bacterium]
MSARAGIGYDSHRFDAGRPLRLGGVTVPHSRGLIGHSDGDVVLHALVDAMLGAGGRGDIGEHFSDKDPKNKGRDSREFVIEARKLVGAIDNVDIIIMLEKPNLTAHKPRIRKSVAQLLGVPVEQVNIKAKTLQGLVKGRGVIAQAVVQLAGPR